MRTVIVLIYILIVYIISVPEWLVMQIVGRISPRQKARFAQWTAHHVALHLLFLSGVKLTVKGKENILQDQTAMYAFNHRGFFDIVVGYATGPQPMAFVAKKSLMKVPVLSRLMQSLQCLPLDREDPKQGLQMVLQGIELLKGDYSVFIAPEGGRNHGEELLPFHEGSFKLADKSHRPIVPVAITRTDDILENHFPWIHSTHVTVEYCNAIDMSQMERSQKKHVGEQVRQVIAETLQENISVADS